MQTRRESLFCPRKRQVIAFQRNVASGLLGVGTAVANLYIRGPIKGINLPALPGYAAVSQQAEERLQNTIDSINTLLATLDQIRLKLQDPTRPPTPAEVWKLLTDAYDSIVNKLPAGPAAEVVASQRRDSPNTSSQATVAAW